MVEDGQCRGTQAFLSIPVLVGYGGYMPSWRRLQVFLITHAMEPLSLIFLHPALISFEKHLNTLGRCFPSSPGTNLRKLTRT